MGRGIVIAGYGATGKTFVGNKYDNVINLESSHYKWDNTGYEVLSLEERKGIVRPINTEWPMNYHKAIIDARNKYDIVLTSTHGHVLRFLQKVCIDYYLAFPTLDSVDVIIERCYKRGNNKNFIDILIRTLYDFDSRLDEYHPVKVLRMNRNEYLEDALLKEQIL